MSVEGVVQSSLMRDERFEQSDGFDEDWFSPAVTWSAGGEEHYAFTGKPAVKMRSAGVLALAAGARYSYCAAGEAPFRSNMIIFPRWIVRAAALSPIENRFGAGAELRTRLFIPDGQTDAFMNAIAARCRRGDRDADWYAEHAVLLYALLLKQQRRAADAQRALGAVKASTRAELARRIERAQHFMLQAYGDPGLDLGAIASAACLSRFHLIRVFKALTGETPMSFLTATRMDAARQLIETARFSVADAATAVGYSGRSAFYRMFKKRFGVAPSALAQR